MKRDNVLPDGSSIDAKQMLLLHDEARRWVRIALERAEMPCARDCRRAVESAVNRIVDIIKAYTSGRIRAGFTYSSLPLAARRKIDEVIRDLVRLVESFICLYGEDATPDKDGKKALYDFLGAEYRGETMRERVEKQVLLLMGRLERFLGDEDAVSDREDRSYADFWAALAVAATDATSTKLLERLAETEVSRAWMHQWANEHRDARFVHVFRGSSYPCSWCDSVVAKGWQALDGNEVVPPLHPNCRCYAVYL